VAIPQTASAVRAQLPPDEKSAYAILDGFTGSRDATMAMLKNARWPHAELAGPDLPADAARPIRLAQNATAVITDIGQTLPSIGDIPVQRLVGGALRIGGAVFTAAALLELNDLLMGVSPAATRAQIMAAIARFDLDPNQAADVLAARAYVYTRVRLPFSFWNLPFSGPVLDRTAEAVMRYERSRPGTMMLATRGNMAAQAAISQIVAESTAGVLDSMIALERTSAVDPALSTSSKRARALLGLVAGQQWQAHHLIPFGVMADQPISFQQAVVASGWVMDSLENLIALPANWPTFIAPPPGNNQVWPEHNGSHINYDADVSAALAPLVAPMPIVMTPQALQQYAANSGALAAALRAGLMTVELGQRSRLFARVYHPKLN
jgi:hypothetical protein